MKSISGIEFAKILEKHVWELARIQGSHHIYVKKGNIDRISIPIHKNEDLKIGLLKHLMKIANLSDKDII
ncbi:MAG: type II toxin-antitoxin system HicA family toxin [Bacteroidetes bacterium]|nr:type II toxin-antitoxin system HicA family toxin [Bacteroidota bacterium]